MTLISRLKIEQDIIEKLTDQCRLLITTTINGKMAYTTNILEKLLFFFSSICNTFN